MGTVTGRANAKGKMRYTAQVRIMRDGKTHTESKTFEREKAASDWLKVREKALKVPGGIEKARAPVVTLAHAIDRYVAESEKEIGKTKAQVLRSVKSYDIADMECSKIGSTEIVAFARELISGDRKPQTVGNYLSHLSAIFTLAKPAWGYALDRTAMDDATVVLKRLGTTGKSKKRSRRPTLEELDALMDHFTVRSIKRPTSSPMARVVAFAVFSTRRLAEILRITWADLDEEGSRVWVRDLKHPGEKIGNDQIVDLPPEALAIIRAMPRTSGRIFPYSEDAIGAAFTRACQVLDIEDLHFHDLRHDGVSRLFEMGWTTARAATVSAHRSWSSLQRYAHVRQVGDKYANWKWLPEVTSPLKKEDASLED